jgi:O-antigen/teichoic acid export membrane protein
MSVTSAAPAGNLVRSADSLLLSTAVSAVLGFGFWIAAARLFPAGEVGRDSALIAAMLELSTICQLNLDNVLVRQLPRLRDTVTRTVAGAYALNAVLALVVGTAFVLIVPSLAEDLGFLREDPVLAVAFVAGLALWGVFTLQDATLTALRHAHWVPVENAVFGALKLLALPLALAVAAAHGVFLAWVVPMVLLLVPVNVLIFGRAAARHRAVPRAEGPALADLGRRRLGVFFAQDYLGQVLMRLAVTVLPVLVVATLGAAANAYFYVPFTIVIAFDMMVLAIGTSLLAESAYDRRLVRAHLQTAVRRYGPLLLAGVAVLVAAAPLVLLPFGVDYAREGAGALRLLALASIPRAILFLTGAVWRLQGHGRWLLGIEALMLVLLLGSVVPLADGLELTGVALAWLGSAAVAGAVAATWMVHHLRHEDR